MATLRLVLGDQLSRGLATLADLTADDVVLMVEAREETTYVPHHPQKIILVLAAMRHFAQALRDDGVAVRYVTLDDPANTGSFSGEVRRALREGGYRRVVVTEPGEWRLREEMSRWSDALDVAVELRTDDRFLCPAEEFRQWAAGRKQLRMEHFYREMRRCTGYLMEGDQPVGGSWNYDSRNRKRLPRGTTPPQRLRFTPDATTREVTGLVTERYAAHFGDAEGFSWGVTRAQALEALDHFVAEALPCFGDYQDFMSDAEDFLYHAVISPYLNVGLLDPREVCAAAIAAYDSGAAPIHCVEGFVRQIIGWREFIRGVYWLRMPSYAGSVYLDAERPLPAFYWGADTDMRCVERAVSATRRNAYAHHIQRLMVTGNFALLAGIRPAEVEAWYLAVYADAFEWVELPNTHGMALFADGGVFASKPYAASGAYINRMSDHCGNCRYDPKQKTGPDACPFNFLYWDFLARNRSRLERNPRMRLAYRNLDNQEAGLLQEMRQQASSFLGTLE